MSDFEPMDSRNITEQWQQQNNKNFVGTVLTSPDYEIKSIPISVTYDEDETSFFGRTAIGYDGSNSDTVIFSHLDNANQTDFAIKQDASGNTVVNCKAGSVVEFRYGMIRSFYVNASGVPYFESAPIFSTLNGILLGNGTSAITVITNNSANWNTAYSASHTRGHTLLSATDHTDIATYLNQALLSSSSPTFAGGSIVNNTDPTLNLDATGDVTGSPCIKLKADRAADGNRVASIYCYNTDANPIAEIQFERGSTDAKGDIKIFTSNAQAVHINESGLFGIGSDPADFKLDVYNTANYVIRATSTLATASAELLRLHHSSASPADNDEAQVFFRSDSADAGATVASIWCSIRQVSIDVTHATRMAALHIYTMNSGGVEKLALVLREDGRVCIPYLAGVSSRAVKADADGFITAP